MADSFATARQMRPANKRLCVFIARSVAGLCRLAPLGSIDFVNLRGAAVGRKRPGNEMAPEPKSRGLALP